MLCVYGMNYATCCISSQYRLLCAVCVPGQVLVPDWQVIPKPIVSDVGTRFGYSSLTVRVPYANSPLPDGVQSLILQYRGRRTSGGVYQTRVIDRSMAAFTVPTELPDDEYFIRFGFLLRNGKTVYNQVHRYILSSQGTLLILICCSILEHVLS